VSQKNVELTRRAIEAFNARDLEAFIAVADPEIEFNSVFADVGGAYSGHDGMRKFSADSREVCGGDIHVEPEAFFDLGEDTLVFQVSRARGKKSGIEVTMGRSLS
jgi:hypothetical protein